MIQTLDLSQALFIHPSCDGHIQTILDYWRYAKMLELKGKWSSPDVPHTVVEAELFLTRNYPHVASAVDRAVIRMLLAGNGK